METTSVYLSGIKVRPRKKGSEEKVLSFRIVLVTPDQQLIIARGFFLHEGMIYAPTLMYTPTVVFSREIRRRLYQIVKQEADKLGFHIHPNWLEATAFLEITDAFRMQVLKRLSVPEAVQEVSVPQEVF